MPDYKNIKKELSDLQADVLLSERVTFGIGGKAKYFLEVKNSEVLIKALQTAKKYNLPFFILGGGSNILVSDKGYNGLVIKISDSSLAVRGLRIYAGAGAGLARLTRAAVEAGLSGLEWAVGIPGTIGGAVYGNAGAFGKTIGETVINVDVLEIANAAKLKKKGRVSEFNIKRFESKDCGFNYRKSVFKKNKNLIILSAGFQLKKGKVEDIKRKIKDYSGCRNKTQPLNFPSAGSIFKNPVFTSGQLAEKNIGAGAMIEKCGLKGKKIGGAKISEKHANFIVNSGGAKAKNVLALINLMKKKVKEKFQVELEEEIQFLGFDKNFPR